MKTEGQNADRIRHEAACVGVVTDRGTQLLGRGITLRREEYSYEIYKALISYAAWQEKFKPEVLTQQKTVWNIEDLVAGTFDKLAIIEGQLHLLEVKKTSGIRRTHLFTPRHTPTSAI